MIKETIKGDLLQLFKENRFSAIAHGCNCFCVQNAGIAKQISTQFPEALQVDKASDDEWINWEKLGNFSIATTEYGEIYNFYTQFQPGPNFEYNALIECLSSLEDLVEEYEEIDTFILGLPAIGCGIGGGDYNIVREILEASSIQIIVVEYDKGNIRMDQREIEFPS